MLKLEMYVRLAITSFMNPVKNFMLLRVTSNCMAIETTYIKERAEYFYKLSNQFT